MSRKFPNLDPLRIFLASMVVVYHVPAVSRTVGLPFFNLLPFFHKGSEAVFVFFVLSGFLIIRSLFIEKEKTGTVRIKDFYLRRILRIYPVYYLVLIFGFVFYHLILPYFNIPFDTSYNVWEGILLCVAFLPNIFQVLYDPGGILNILWSIGIEEQFYLIIAPIAYFLAKKRFQSFLLGFSIVFFLIYFFEPFEFFAQFYMLFFYFSFGGLLSVLNHQKQDGWLLFNKAGQFALYIIFLAYFLTDLFLLLPTPAYHFFSMIFFGLFVLNISRNPDPIIIIENANWNYLGKISYGVYMYHMIMVNIVLFGMQKLLPVFPMPDFLTIIFINVGTMGLTILAAHLSFKYYERVFLNLKGTFRKTKTDASQTVSTAKPSPKTEEKKTLIEDILAKHS